MLSLDDGQRMDGWEGSVRFCRSYGVGMDLIRTYTMLIPAPVVKLAHSFLP